MDVREKLVELLKPYVSGLACEQESGSCELTDCRSCNALWAARKLIAHGVTVQGWISTDERMPTEDDSTDGYVAVVYTGGDGVNTKTISLVDVVISHPDLYDYWMPLNLPQPPKGE